MDNFTLSLSTDIWYKIGSLLKGKHLIVFTNSCRYFKNIFTSKKCDHLWRQKLLEEYNVLCNSGRPIDDYLYYIRSQKQKYWAVSYHPIRGDPSHNRDYQVKLFLSKDDAIKYIYNYIKSTGFPIDSHLDYFYEEINRYGASTIVGDDICLTETYPFVSFSQMNVSVSVSDQTIA